MYPALGTDVYKRQGSYRGRTELDCTDKFLCPGFIDAHIHIESSLAAPFEFARAATRSGTTTIVADPHEIVNVCGAQACLLYTSRGR